jgi:hypothetical protein
MTATGYCNLGPLPFKPAVRGSLFAVVVYALEFSRNVAEVGRFHPLIDHGTGDVNVLPKLFYVMSAEEEAVKESRFPLGR